MMAKRALGEPPSGAASAVPAFQTGQAAPLPEFVPLPREGQVEFYSGLRRGALNFLLLPMEANGGKPPVKSISLRRPGNSKGKRLIALEGIFGSQPGLLTYLRKLRDEQPAEPAGTSSEAR